MQVTKKYKIPTKYHGHIRSNKYIESPKSKHAQSETHTVGKPTQRQKEKKKPMYIKLKLQQHENQQQTGLEEGFYL